MPFLIFIIVQPDRHICNLLIYAGDSTLYSFLDKKSDISQRFDLAYSLEKDLTSITDWGEQWSVTFNSAKTKLLSFNRYRDSSDIPISMSGDLLAESPGFRLLGLTISKDLTWNEYIKGIAKTAAMKVGSLYTARRYLSPEIILYLYKSLIRPCMEYCCHIWAGAPASCLRLLDRIQRRIANIVGPDLASGLPPLSHRRDVASLSLFYKCYNGACSLELASLVPPPKFFSRATRLSVTSHPYTVEVPKCKKSFYANSFFPRTSILWNSLPIECFPDSYNIQIFKSRVNQHLAAARQSF